MSPMTWVAVGVGGALGSLARHGVNVVFSHRLVRLDSYYGTAAVNVIGSLVIGVLAGKIAAGHLHLSAEARAFVFVGLLGGFTTFSSLMLDTLTLIQGGRTSAALLNVVVQVVLGYTAVYVGFRITS
jgi:fluoride exporter